MKQQIKSLISVIAFYILIVTVAGTRAPINLVLTGSMEPSIKPGDIMLVTGYIEPRLNDIIVYAFNNTEIPIMHRVSATKIDSDGNILYRTKGDNNSVDDYYGNIYPPGEKWVHNNIIIGTVRGQIPYIGLPLLLIAPYFSYVRAVLLLILVIQILRDK